MSTRRTVAIIGMSGRFPGANSVSQFWENLCGGVESLTLSTDEELIANSVDPSLLKNPAYQRAGGIIEDADTFDAGFFNINAREAEIIDPQHRVFLECAWEAFEDAGYDPTGCEYPIGVFAGCGLNTYSLTSLFSNPDVMASVGGYQVMVGNDKDFLATRIAYKLDLKGPAVNVQTACSTSLVAVQMAFESLLRNECDMALAGGVSIQFPQKAGYLYSPGMILSPDGHCRAFDAKAAGTVPGRGSGVVLLKLLDQALADHDHIYAVIRGAAINNDGAAKVGYSAPSVEGQRRVIAKSMEMASFTPESVHYVEAHGTGTEVGDPIEVAALTQVFQGANSSTQYCALGSVKTNIGHLDTAAGVTGLIKTALTIRHRTIPPTLHFEKPNPLIPFSASPFYVNTKLNRYEGDAPFRAGVSSFGIGGTNAHLSLEEVPRMECEVSDTSQLIILSARTEAALQTQARNLKAFLDKSGAENLSDIAFTLQQRHSFSHRQIITANSVDDLKEVLDSDHFVALRSAVAVEPAPKVVFLFPGQGSQYAGMGHDLYQSLPCFREQIDLCAKLLQKDLGFDFRTLLYSEEQAENADDLLSQTWVTQPVLFAFEYALASAWMHLGIQPAAMLGHSIGEYVAACIAGVFTLEDALALLVQRGKVVFSLEAGAMLAIARPPADLTDLLRGTEVSIAAENSPEQTVLSGSLDAVARLEKMFDANGMEYKRLRTSHAFHSSMLDPIVDTFADHVSKMQVNPPKMPFLSNLSGTWITAEQATDPKYWAAHLRNTVKFSSNIQELAAMPNSAFLEVGPGETLLSFIRQHPAQAREHTLVASTRAAKAIQNDYTFWLRSLGRLWLGGLEPAWNQLYEEHLPYRVSLPTYPFERQRYWIEPVPQSFDQQSALSAALIKRKSIDDWFYIPSWKRTLLPSSSASQPLAGNEVWLIADDSAETIGGSFTVPHSDACVRVVSGEEFSQLPQDKFQLSPVAGKHWKKLLNQLRSQDRWPARIVFAANFAGSAENITEQIALQNNFLSLMFLMQAITEISLSRQVRLDIVARGSLNLGGQERLDAVVSSLPIVGEIISLECPNISCRFIDLDSKSAPGQATILERELASPAVEPTVAYRGKSRWVSSYVPAQIQMNTEPLRLVQRGTYLITGGLGGLGLTFANYLAKNFSAHVVLTTRNEFPDQREWRQALETSDNKALKSRIRGLMRVIDSGGTIEIVHVDASDRSSMRSLAAKYSALCGVIHAAGLPSSSMIQSKSTAEAIATLIPKVAGSAWIKDFLEIESLQFVLLCSSISSIVPSFGLADYAAANAYLDALANAFDDPFGKRVISVNWDTWSEVGMAAAPAATQDDAWASHAITPAEGEAVFERVLRCTASQVVVSTLNLTTLLDTVHTASKEGVQHLFQRQNNAKNAHPRPELSQAYVEPQNEMEVAVVEIWQSLLGIDKIGRHDNFFELGGHSLLGTQVIARIRNRFAFDLPLRAVFEAPTPAELAEMLRTIPWATGANTTTPLLQSEREEIEI